MSRDRLRTAFDEVAELYDRVRPAYPAELVDALAEWIRSGARVLEIGPGTGLATEALAERGYDVVGVELGARLAAIARRRLVRFPNAEVIEADFEMWEPERGGFDAVVAFTAAHWLSDEARYRKPARLLRPHGVLAIVKTVHVRDDDLFWLDVQEDHDAVTPGPDNTPPPRPEEIDDDVRRELEANGYVDVETRRYPHTVTYTADDYVALLSTYSRNIARNPATTKELLDRIHRRVAARPGGVIANPYVFVLTVGRYGSARGADVG